jgi:molecular chaperone GrpE
MAAKQRNDEGDAPGNDVADPDVVEPAERERGTGNGSTTAERAPDPASELEAAKRETAEIYDRLLRAQAELQNVLKRHERDRAERVRYAAEPLARDLLAPVDDLDRALAHAEGSNDSLVEGVRMVRTALLAALQRHGVERIEALGKSFDPRQHEAVIVLETADQPPGTVAAVHRAGYRLHDRLLRPALVAVAKAPASSGTDADGSESGFERD